jgi:hypothetical protein
MGYRDYRQYRNWLRDEFSFRCVYCLRRETWLTLRADWQLDHFIPKSRHPQGALDYDNLVYACSTCNHSKAAHLAPDPCAVAYGGCVRIDNNGEIHALNEAGVNLVETLALDDEEYNEMRRAIFELLHDLPAGGRSFLRLFGYPKNLPDLSKEPAPPGGNRRQDGIRESCFEKDKRGRLPEYY